MNTRSYLSFLAASLPKSLAWEQLESLIPKHMWHAEPMRATAEALAKLDMLDGDDYLIRYPDVKEAGIDPLTHFALHGLKENRFVRLKDSLECIGAYNGKIQKNELLVEFKNGIAIPQLINREQKVLEIAYFIDNYNLFPSIVSLYSLFINSNKSIYHNIYIFAGDSICDQVGILKRIETPNFKLNIIPYESINIGNFKFQNNSVLLKIAILSRFLTTAENILLIGCNSIIKADLSDILNIDMDNCCVAGTIDIRQKLELDTFTDEYVFNEGVMWLNLKKIRGNAIFCDAGANNFQPDDISVSSGFNEIFNGQICFIDSRYNCALPQALHADMDLARKFYERPQEIGSRNDIIAKAKVITYAGDDKPWSANACEHARTWFSYADAVKSNFAFDTPYIYDPEVIDYKFRRYYHGGDPIAELPGYREEFVRDGIVEKRRYMDKAMLDDREGKLPICISPHTAPVYVSLTTTPERLNGIYPTLYSLVNQTLRPKGILLWLPEDEFGGKPEIPSAVKALRAFGVDIRIIPHGFRSHTKLLPALAAYPEEIIIVADDDIFYEKEMIIALYNSWLGDKKAICALRAKRISLGMNGRPQRFDFFKPQLENAAGFDLLEEGCGGVLFPPGCFHADVAKEDKFLRLAPYADDLWFWAMGVMGGTRTRFVRSHIYAPIFTDVERELHGHSLQRINMKGGQNEVQLANLLDAYPELYKHLRRAVR